MHGRLAHRADPARPLAESARLCSWCCALPPCPSLLCLVLCSAASPSPAASRPSPRVSPWCCALPPHRTRVYCASLSLVLCLADSTARAKWTLASTLCFALWCHLTLSRPLELPGVDHGTVRKYGSQQLLRPSYKEGTRPVIKALLGDLECKDTLQILIVSARPPHGVVVMIL